MINISWIHIVYVQRIAAKIYKQMSSVIKEKLYKCSNEEKKINPKKLFTHLNSSF